MLTTGTGSEIRQPLGYAIIGGLLVSQVLTLSTIPTIYMDKRRMSSRRSCWPAGTPIARHAPMASAGLDVQVA